MGSEVQTSEIRSQIINDKLLARVAKPTLFVTLLVAKAVGGTFIILGVARVFGAPGSVGFILSISGGGALVCASSAALVGSIVFIATQYKLKRKKELDEANTLFKAVQVNSKKRVDELLAKGDETINIVDEHGNTLAHEAARLGHSLLLDHLLTHGCVTNAVNNDGDTPLHLAARGGHYHTAYKLLNHEADCTPLNNDGKNPLHEAATCGKEEVVGVILTKHPDLLHAQDSTGCTVFHHAAASSYNVFLFLNTIEENQKTLELEDKDGATPLFYAILNGKKRTVHYLKDRVSTNGTLLNRYLNYDNYHPDTSLSADDLNSIESNLVDWNLLTLFRGRRINSPSTGDETV